MKIYYNEKGQKDYFMTYINNNDWCLYVVVIMAILLSGVIR